MPAGGLLLHPFTLTPVAGAVYFLWHWPADCSEWVLPTILPCGVRTFLDRSRDHPQLHPEVLILAKIGLGT